MIFVYPSSGWHPSNLPDDDCSGLTQAADTGEQYKGSPSAEQGKGPPFSYSSITRQQATRRLTSLDHGARRSAADRGPYTNRVQQVRAAPTEHGAQQNKKINKFLQCLGSVLRSRIAPGAPSLVTRQGLRCVPLSSVSPSRERRCSRRHARHIRVGCHACRLVMRGNYAPGFLVLESPRFLQHRPQRYRGNEAPYFWRIELSESTDG